MSYVYYITPQLHRDIQLFHHPTIQTSASTNLAQDFRVQTAQRLQEDGPMHHGSQHHKVDHDRHRKEEDKDRTVSAILGEIEQLGAPQCNVETL